MPDPVTISVVGGWVALEGIKFLYGQAGELLKAWRERHRSVEEGEDAPAELTVPFVASEVLDATPTEPVVDAEVLDRHSATLTQLYGVLAPYAQELAILDPTDAEFAEKAGQLRALIEAAYGQRLTFRGELRDPTGTRVSVTQVLDDVAGAVVGIDGAIAPGVIANVHQWAGTVQRGGSLRGVTGDIGC